MSASPLDSDTPRRLPRVPRADALSERGKRLFLAAGIFLIFGSLIVIASAFFVNHMKNELVRVAHEEVRDSVQQAKLTIEQAIAEQAAREGREITSLADVANNPTVKAQMRIMTTGGSVVLSALIDNDGNCVFQQFGQDMPVHRCPLRPGGRIGGIIPPSDEGLTWELEMRDYPASVSPERVPIEMQGQTLGFIEFGVEDDLTLARMLPISATITRSLVWMVALVMLCLGMAIMMLQLFWNRHEELLKRHSEAEHLATIGTLASGLAHEIRNPLHAMNLHLEAVREELEDPRSKSPEFAGKTIANVQRQITSLNATLSSFMNYALPGTLERDPVRLAPLVCEVTSLLAPEFEQRRVTVRREIPESAWILGDATALRQVLTNVLLNAAQALEKSDRREVVVSARAVENGRWVLDVDDTGPGLPAGKVASIFDVFVSGRPGGSGFGLPIARRIMEDHGGGIHGESLAGGGARFTLDFPACDPPGDKTSSPAPDTAPGVAKPATG